MVGCPSGLGSTNAQGYGISFPSGGRRVGPNKAINGNLR